MEFTKYLWDLYKGSEKGKKEISLFEKGDINQLSKQFEFEYVFDYETDEGKIERRDFYSELINDLASEKLSNLSEAREFFEESFIEDIKEDKFNYFLEDIELFSTVLYHLFPDFFLPFYFNRDNYPEFLRLSENFEISILPNPSRNDWIKRTWYYFEICETFHSFRRKHNIESKEFPAFLYFFGLNCLQITKQEELPKPSKIYFLGAGAGMESEEDNWDFQFLDNAIYTSTNTWGAGGLNIKKGDLVLMYCLSPRKKIHSIWRALDDSFIAPFSYYYYGVKVGFPFKVPQISFQELKTNQIFKDNPTVKANMQGLNGRPLSVIEYEELKNLIEIKGLSKERLPQLPVYIRNIQGIENERDVELKLVEPLLRDLNLMDTDWIRQLPLKMGRQTKYYPDYAIKVNNTKGKERARIILETKYSINTKKQLDEAFTQARSYALRLSSELIILADIDFIWLFEKSKYDFNSEFSLKFHWNELTNSDNLFQVKKKIKAIAD